MPDQPVKAGCPFDRHWQVKTGDTLYFIAQAIGTTVEVLVKLNPDLNPLHLQPGDIICLPPARPCPSGVFWVLEQGDTFFRIAQATNTSVEKLKALNPDLNPLHLQVGQKICLP